jgi:ATP-dependent exoDNAse (exonuclease V) alpha subunit
METEMSTANQNIKKPGAIFHFTCKVHGRSSGPCSVNLAAYRAGDRLRSERTGRICNHTRKKEVLWSKILAPVEAPAWAGDRATLWNAVDAYETRKDAQLAREVEVALPLALAPSDNCALLLEWAEKTFVSQGMVADVCYHNKRGNPHAHILLTLRDIDAGGFGKKNRSWNNQSQVESWRASWAEIVNRYLEKAGLDVRIDHRSFKRQGIDLTPTKHVGRLTPHNSERFAEVSLNNKIILMERDLLQQKQEQNKAARIAAFQKPETQTPSPACMSPQRPPRLRRPRPARLLPTPGFVSGSEPSF